MQLHFHNQHRTLLWVCIGFYSPGTCGAQGDWRTRGWWTIAPGGEVYVLDTNNRFAYCYAEAADGKVWAGHYGPVLAPRRAFDSCWNILNNVDPRVHMREIYIPTDHHIIDLI